MKPFDIEKHRAEARERWGQTDAYREHETKTKNYSKADWEELAGEMEEIFSAFAGCMARGDAPDSSRAQGLVERLRSHITGNYYHCTKEILAGLGQMYVGDDRFLNNIDRHAPGTAAFAARAIQAFCAK